MRRLALLALLAGCATAPASAARPVPFVERAPANGALALPLAHATLSLRGLGPWSQIPIVGTGAAAPTVPPGMVGMVGFSVRLLERFARDFRPVPAGGGAAGN